VEQTDPRDEFLRYARKRLQQAEDELARLQSPGVVTDPSAVPTLEEEISLLSQYIQLATDGPHTRDDFIRDLRKVSKPEE
jgi:hypothetical protein